MRVQPCKSTVTVYNYYPDWGCQVDFFKFGEEKLMAWAAGDWTDNHRFFISVKCLWPLNRDGPWPDPTRAYFWPAVNKRPTRLLPEYFPTQPEEIFFDPKGKKLKNLTFLGEIFQIQTQIINGWPNPSHKKLTQPDPGQKFLTQTHHYLSTMATQLAFVCQTQIFICAQQ